MKNIKDIINILDYKEIINSIDCSVTDVHYDSRKCAIGSIFVAIKGEVSDGHNYIYNAIENGAKVIVCEEKPREIVSNSMIIIAESSRRALAQLSDFWHCSPSKKMKVIGVTGTNGKTTTTFIIAQILSELGKKVGIIGTTGIFYNETKIEATHTTPESLELQNILQKMYVSGVEIVVMEVSSHSLEMYRVHLIAFDVAIFTNLSHEHLDYHHTMDNYANAKKKLFLMLGKDSIAIVQNDDKYSKFMTEGIVCNSIVKVGRKEHTNYQIIDEFCKLDGISYKVLYNNQSIPIELGLVGKFNIDNSALAISACIELGYDLDSILGALTKVTGAEGRMLAKRIRTGAVGIVDYSHNPDALENALLTCRNMIESNVNKTGKLICVFGCGGDRDKSKRSKMGNISANLADISIITDDNPRTEDPSLIRKEIISGISPENISKIIEIASRSDAIQHAVNISEIGDIVLLAGKGHEKYQIIGKDKFHFDDSVVLWS